MTPAYQPMLATPFPRPFADPEWYFDLKWDGYRCLAYVAADRVTLRSRNGNDLGPRYPELRGIRSPVEAVVDGEIVAIGDDGRPSFFLLGRVPAQLAVFDLLFLDGDLTSSGLEERRRRLDSMTLSGPVIRPELVRGEGEALFTAVVDQGLEGIVAKRAGSRYHPGKRSPDWRKIVNRRRLRAVVGGYLRGEGSRATTFGSLLVGLWSQDGLRLVGATGSGFDQKTLDELAPILRAIERKQSPFAAPVDLPGEKVWVEPRLVVMIEYREWTPAGRLRAPVYQGMVDVVAELVTWEAEHPET